MWRRSADPAQRVHFQKIQERKQAEERQSAAKERIASNSTMTEKLSQLHTDFLATVADATPQGRGYKLEKLLNELFLLFDLHPKGPFKITGEQIDGAFTFDSTDYLLEAKWQKPEDVNLGILRQFAGSVDDKRKGTLGLFISMDGFSSECLAGNQSSLRSIILMKGEDLDAVLTGRIKLDELLFRKRRHHSETGQPFLSAYQMAV